MKLSLVPCVCYLLIPLSCSPLIAMAAGQEGATFLGIPTGARPAAMGSAYSALATDAYAPVWNPAGLGELSSVELSGQHLSYLDSVHDEFASFVYPMGHTQGIGASVQYLATGDISSTNNFGDSLGTFSSHYGAYSLAYGRTLGKGVSVGVSGKVIQAAISDVSAQAYSADLGALYRPTSRLSLAAVCTNLGSRLRFLSQSDSLPLAGHVGLAYQSDSAWAWSVEGVLQAHGLFDARAGAEWQPVPMLAIRAGYRTDTLQELGAWAGFSTGIGLLLWGQEFSYAWVPYGDLGSTQYFSFLLRFGRGDEARRNLARYQGLHRYQMVSSPHAPSEYPYPEYEHADQPLPEEDLRMITGISADPTEDHGR